MYFPSFFMFDNFDLYAIYCDRNLPCYRLLPLSHLMPSFFLAGLFLSSVLLLLCVDLVQKAPAAVCSRFP